MKKLLVFVLVLGTASAANAALSLQIGDVDVPSTVDIVIGSTIQVVSDDDTTWLGYLIIETGGAGALSNPVIYTTNPGPPITYGPPAGDNSYIKEYTYVGWGDGYEMAADWLSAATKTGPGMQFSAVITGNVGDQGVLSLWKDPEYNTPAYPSINYTLVIPEPATIALLGLGCLLLRRHKK